MDRVRARRIEQVWRRHTVTPIRAPGSKPPYVFPLAWYPGGLRWRLAPYRAWSLLRCRVLLRSLGRLLSRYALEIPREHREDPVRFLRAVWFDMPSELNGFVDSGELTAEDL
jgi:hypothetical protein